MSDKRLDIDLVYYGVLCGEQKFVCSWEVGWLCDLLRERYGLDAAPLPGLDEPLLDLKTTPVIEIRHPVGGGGTEARVDRLTFAATCQAYLSSDPLRGFKVEASSVTCPTCLHTKPGPEVLRCQTCKKEISALEGRDPMAWFRYAALLHRKEGCRQ